VVLACYLLLRELDPTEASVWTTCLRIYPEAFSVSPSAHNVFSSMFLIFSGPGYISGLKDWVTELLRGIKLVLVGTLTQPGQVTPITRHLMTGGTKKAFVVDGALRPKKSRCFCSEMSTNHAYITRHF